MSSPNPYSAIPNQYNSPSNGANAGTIQNAPPPIPPEKFVQFRVMRLYKPSLYMSPHLPAMTSNAHVDPLSSGQQTNDFIISPYILLPDSFGDIYLGETFSAYIAVVTGIQEIPLHNVFLTVRLQTISTNYDLSDVRPLNAVPSGSAKVLQPFESMDVIINHKLTELGTHTLRATVQFTANKSSEITTVRKFYRFNVLQPLNITSSYIIMDGRILVQCIATNLAKAQIVISEVKFISPIADAIVLNVQDLQFATKSPDSGSQSIDISKYCPYDIQILNPSETYAFAFIISLSKDHAYQDFKDIGHAEIRWSSPFGEGGTMIGNEATTYQANAEDFSSSGSIIKIGCSVSPATASIGKPFDVVIRISNNSRQNLALRLVCQSNAENNQNNDGDKLTVIGISNMNIGTVNAGSYVEKTLLIYPSATGLQELKELTVIDSSGKEYISGALFKVMVIE